MRIIVVRKYRKTNYYSHRRFFLYRYSTTLSIIGSKMLSDYTEETDEFILGVGTFLDRIIENWSYA